MTDELSKEERIKRFQEKRESRINRFQERADKAKEKGKQCFQRSRDLVKHIPPGQPILVGHHSEKRHRRTFERSHQAMDSGHAELEKAKYYAQKASAAESNTAISSDDPEAIEKLKKKLAALKAEQELMKKLNAYYKKHGTCVGFEGFNDEKARQIDEKIESQEHYLQKRPFQSFDLTCNNANIKSTEKRIKDLERLEACQFQGWTFDGGKVEFDRNDNRIRIIFDGIPNEAVRKNLKSHGFHWSRMNRAWQRQITDSAIYQAKQITGVNK